MGITRRAALAGPAALAGSAALPTTSTASTADLVALAERSLAEFRVAMTALTKGVGGDRWGMSIGASWGPEPALVDDCHGSGTVGVYIEGERIQRGRPFWIERHIADIEVRDGSMGLRWRDGAA